MEPQAVLFLLCEQSVRWVTLFFFIFFHLSGTFRIYFVDLVEHLIVPHQFIGVFTLASGYVMLLCLLACVHRPRVIFTLLEKCKNG